MATDTPRITEHGVATLPEQAWVRTQLASEHQIHYSQLLKWKKQGAILSRIPWSEKSPAGQGEYQSRVVSVKLCKFLPGMREDFIRLPLVAARGAALSRDPC